MELFKTKERERKSIKKYGYTDDAKKFMLISKDLNNKLDAIEQELKKKYASLELATENIEEIQNISNILLEFKDFDETLFLKIENKIAELTAIKENATKNYDFKTASIAREESGQLQEYFNEHKHYLG